MSIVLQPNNDGTSSFVSTDGRREALHIDGAKGSYVDPATYVQLFDHFLGDVLADQWSGAKGTDAQGIVPTIVAGEAGGVVRTTCGDTTVVAESVSILTHGLNWKANQGGLYMKARVRLNTSVADVAVCVGFTDVLATTTLEEPFSISGTTITSNATDAVCFVYDTAQTNDAWHIQGVKADTNTAINNTTVAPAIDTWVTLEIELDTSGNATFYINGVSYGTVANAVTATVALTPVVSIMARTTTVKVIDVDYIMVAARTA